MTRLLLTLRFDGTGYHGWQVQPNGRTVQQTLQDAIESVTGVRSGVTGCSRTDAGVHAAMFCCTTDTDSAMRGGKMAAALNARLPRDIAVYDCREAPEGFHPRYDAAGKTYRYRIWNAPCRNPFWERYAYHVRRALDGEAMAAAAAAAVGRHDFRAFCAAGSGILADGGDTTRTVRDCGVEREDELVTLTVTADGFLYNMVRILAGTVIEAGLHRRSPASVAEALRSGRRDDAGPTAPAHGLILQKVYYDKNIL